MHIFNLGASVVGSPKEVASQTSILVTMLPASSHVLDVYTGSSGILRWDSPTGIILSSLIIYLTTCTLY